jgi:hypothetical protein
VYGVDAKILEHQRKLELLSESLVIRRVYCECLALYLHYAVP